MKLSELLRWAADEIEGKTPSIHAIEPTDHADLIVLARRDAQRISVADVDAVWTATMGHILHLSDPDRLRCVIAWIDASIKAGMEGK